jgi:hypothetical protein
LGVGFEDVTNLEGAQCPTNNGDGRALREVDSKILVHAKQVIRRTNLVSATADGKTLRELFCRHQILLQQLGAEPGIIRTAYHLRESDLPWKPRRQEQVMAMLERRWRIL